MLCAALAAGRYCAATSVVPPKDLTNLANWRLSSAFPQLQSSSWPSLFGAELFSISSVGEHWACPQGCCLRSHERGSCFCFIRGYILDYFLAGTRNVCTFVHIYPTDWRVSVISSDLTLHWKANKHISQSIKPLLQVQDKSNHGVLYLHWSHILSNSVVPNFPLFLWACCFQLGVMCADQENSGLRMSFRERKGNYVSFSESNILCGVHCIVLYLGYCLWRNCFLSLVYVGFLSLWLVIVTAKRLYSTGSSYRRTILMQPCFLPVLFRYVEMKQNTSPHDKMDPEIFTCVSELDGCSRTGTKCISLFCAYFLL